jgi:hypothetical protein
MLILPMLLGAFRSPKPENSFCCGMHLMVTGTSFHALQSSSIPRSVPGLELGIDRANEVELLFAPPAFELFFPSDGCLNVFVTLKVEQAPAAIGRSEAFERALLMLHDAQIQVAGDANVKRACMAAENVDVAAAHNEMLAVLVLGPRERPWRVRQERASMVEKL